ncbi:unnamed protein product [Rhizoctonia solani]|uniref:Cuticle-degrading protease n=1 Tax=Rhizoctonia solani TaxID=456999 RepID=A0A8H3DBR2_9AGAM|nr:unnamed protein product [Rhizoctonia solani]
MHSSFVFALLASSVCSVLAGPVGERIPITKRAGPIKVNSYIIKLKDGVSKPAHLASLKEGSKVAYTYDRAFQGYSAQLEGKALEYIRQSKDVEYIVQDEQVKLPEISTADVQVSPRNSGSKDSSLLKRANGAGVDVYQIDTGIYTAHTQFGGRAKWGATFGGYPNADGNGHGTGFGDDGSANLSDIIQGINWVITNAPPTGRPSIISLTVTISGYQPFDTAVTNALNAGIHVAVAAGDQNVDASTISPARVVAAVTVGAVATNGNKLPTSNFGSVVDVWGPGKNVPVAWISSPTAAVNLVGTTSSAASNVAGILAVAIDNHGNKSPAALQADLKSNAQTVNGFLIPKVW